MRHILHAGRAGSARRAAAKTSRVAVHAAAVGLLWCVIALTTTNIGLACTAFCAVGAGQVLVGNNEDWNNPRTRIWFVPATSGTYGRVYVGFDDLWPQGGMNERGLWFDGFAAPPMQAASSANLPRFPGNIVEKAMAECATVEEVVRLFSQYNRDFLREAILMFADASGDAVSIEPDAMVRKTGAHFVQTNFHQSRGSRAAREPRFETASQMLEQAGDRISVDLFRRILAATHQNGGSPTLYSNVYDLRARTMHLYAFHDFEHVVRFDLAEELKKGEHVLDIPALFPKNAAAETFAARPRPPDRPSDRMIVTAIAIPGLGIVAAAFGWIRGGRRVRVGLSAIFGTLAMTAALSALALHLHPRTSASWTEFSIGPASGNWLTIQPSLMRSTGVSLTTAIAVAYGIPADRVVGPTWLADARYSLTAVADSDDPGAFRPMLQQELENRLRLKTHIEVRSFDVFVLTTTDAPRLELTRSKHEQTSISEWDAQLWAASTSRLASALQSVVGRPVVDETGLSGSYDIKLEWGEDRVATLTAALHDRFGLRLSPAKRDLEALIVDHVQRDAALLLMAEVGQITQGSSPHVRRTIAGILTIR